MSRRVATATKLRPPDALGEAVASIAARPGRAILGCLGTLLGAAWFVAMLGLVTSAAGQVATAFNERLATRLIVTSRQPGQEFQAGLQRRLTALPGVLAAGVFWQVKLGEPVRVTVLAAVGLPASGGHGTRRTRANSSAAIPVIAATPGFLAAAGVRVSLGRTFGAWDQAHAVPACLVGAQVARSLGVGGLRGRPMIAINQVGCVVVGIVGRVGWRQSVLRSVLLPSFTAIALWGPPREQAGARPAVLIRVRPGAAAVVARQAPVAIDPAEPHQFLVSVPTAPERLRGQVTGALRGEYALLGWLGLVAGGLAIATTTMVGVLQRGAEFGLRRLVGARRRHIAAQVLTESAILGVTGGLAGTSLGVAVVAIVAVTRHWVPVIEPKTVLYAPLAAAATGMLAGLLACAPGAWIAPARALTRLAPD